MTVSSDFRVSLPNTVPLHTDLSLGLDADGLASQPRNFKRHKVLPHPHKDDPQQLMRARYGRLGSERTSLQNAAPSGPRPYNIQRPTRTGRGPEPPPTPPAHSRTSSASHPTDPSSTEQVGNRSRPGSRDDSESRLPVTPPDQQTPPTPNLTPDRTPPGPAAGRVERRPPLSDRNASKLTTDSTTESFRTAREDPYSSDDDDGRSTLRPTLSSAKSSQSTVRQINGAARGKPQPVGLGLGLEPSARGEEAPRTTKEFAKFDGEWAGGEAAANGAGEEWDDQLMRNVTIRKRRPTRPRQADDQEILDDRTVTPTNATRALRSMSLQESPIVYPSRRVVSDRLPSRTAPSNSESSVSIDAKRSSIMSTRSTASTVVSAVLVETAPQRRKTLRHVRKQIALRDSGSEISPASSAPTSISPAIEDKDRRDASTPRLATDGARDSYASTATSNSISSRKARREVWKHGGVPVVIVPDRRSSVKSSKPPSLRSTSSRRSPSVSSVSASQPSKSKEHVPQFERSVRRSRAFSESDGSRAGDERTMDFPPVIPARSSSLSAPTSRNASRTGSLTTDSLRAHNMFQAQQAHHALQLASRELDKLHSQTEPTTDDGASRRQKEGAGPTKSESERSQPTVLIESALQDEQKEPNGNTPQLGSQYGSPDMNLDQGKLGVDRDGDPFYGKRLSVQNTPFSVASVETTGTSHAEVSEALAVNIYPHQSKSVVLVDHSSKPSESSTLEQYKHAASDIPVLKTTDANGGVPVTPPQQFSFDDVDSPLRNPRAPPLPPAINFIPATPSGLTPATEKQKQLGNYYEMTTEKPKRSMSLLKRALLSRRVSEYDPSPSRPAGLLTRTFSLSRNVRRRPGDWDDERPRLKRSSTADDVPADETRLHPFWRPAYAADDDSDGSSSGEDDYDEDDDDHDERRSELDEDDRTYRYPPIDNRPSSLRPPRRTRSLSERIRRTFAILPQRGSDRYRDRYDSYPATAHDAPDRRTIRRTPSGNLRVMKFRRSMESLTRLAPPEGAGHGSGYFGTHSEYQQQQRRPPTRGYTRLWRSLSLRATQTLSPRRTGSIGGGGFFPVFFSRQRRSSSPVITGPLALGAGRRSSVPGTGTGFETATAPAPTTTGFAHPTSINTNNPRTGGPNTSTAATTRPGLARSLSERLNLPRRLSERRREKRTQALRRMISAPREVRDGVGDVIRRESWRREREEGRGWSGQQQQQQQQQQGLSQSLQQGQGQGRQQQQQGQGLQQQQQQYGITGTGTGAAAGVEVDVSGGADADEDADARYMREQQAERRRRRRQMWQEKRQQEEQQQGQQEIQMQGQVQSERQSRRREGQYEGQLEQMQGRQQWERQGRRVQG